MCRALRSDPNGVISIDGVSKLLDEAEAAIAHLLRLSGIICCYPPSQIAHFLQTQTGDEFSAVRSQGTVAQLVNVAAVGRVLPALRRGIKDAALTSSVQFDHLLSNAIVKFARLCEGRGMVRLCVGRFALRSERPFKALDVEDVKLNAERGFQMGRRANHNGGDDVNVFDEPGERWR
jgi:hypothetical protein